MGEYFKNFDPDKIPQLNIESITAGRRRRPVEDPKRLQYWIRESREKISTNQRKIVYPPASGRLLYPGITWGAFTTVPIRSGKETPDSVLPTMRSIADAASQIDRPVLVLPWINYELPDPRREADAIVVKEREANELVECIVDSFPTESNVRLLVGIDPLPYPASIPHIKNNAGYALAGCLFSYMPYMQQTHRRTPFLTCDADTTIGPETFNVLSTRISARHDTSLFVNGRVHYTGGVMERKIEEIKQMDTNSKFVYIMERMRRAMFDHLEPTAFRGYLPETGLAMRWGTFTDLDLYYDNSGDNESYFLLLKAEEALNEWGKILGQPLVRRGDVFASLPIDAKYYLDGSIVNEITCGVSYEDYEVNTAIRGIESAVRKNGRNTLVGFDQTGKAYTLWTRDEDSSAGPIQEPEPDQTEVLTLLNSMYSYFYSYGGRLRERDRVMLVMLLRKIDLIDNNTSWEQTILEKKDWLTLEKK